MKQSSFKDRLLLLLINLDYSQSELSALTGVTRAAISRYLKGERIANADTLVAIADKTNVSVNWLLGYGPDDPMERLV